MLTGIRKIIKKLVEPNATILDIGCGTGALIFYLSGWSGKVIGMDISENMIKYARITGERLRIKNVELLHRDVIYSNSLSEIHFDYAILSMVLHQFSIREANQIITLAKSTADRMIMADFIQPMPHSIAGFGASMIERKAGGDHYRNFQDYQKQGGLNYYLHHHQLVILEETTGGLGVIQVVKSSSQGW